MTGKFSNLTLIRTFSETGSLSLHFVYTIYLVIQIKTHWLCVQALELKVLPFYYVAAVCHKQQCPWHPTKVHGKTDAYFSSLWFRLSVHN